MSLPQRRAKPHGGFTLIEVLVALLVLALAMSALQLRMAQQLDSAAYLRERSLAQWVALDELERARLAAQLGAILPDTGLNGQTQLAGQRWYWNLIPQPLPPGMDDVGFIPVSLAVRTERDGAALLSIEAVLERVHAP